MGGKRRITGIAYIRVSTWSQVGNDSAPRQTRAIEAWAKEHGVHVPAWHYDLGISGTKMPQDRPGLMSAFASARLHHATLLLVEAWDRAARGPLVEVHAAAEAIGLRLIACDDWPETIDDHIRERNGMTSEELIAEYSERIENALLTEQERLAESNRRAQDAAEGKADAASL